MAALTSRSCHPGQRLTLTIEDLAFGGEGVARWQGFVVFVGGVAPGDVVDVEVTEVRPRFARARGLRLLTPSPQREVPLCRHFGACGGCHWQMLSEKAENEAKSRVVREQIRRLAHLEEAPELVRPAPEVPSLYGCRHKVDWHFVPQEGGWRLGYHQRDPHRLLAVQECPILHPLLWELSERVQALLQEMGWPICQPATHQGLLERVSLRVSATREEATVLLLTTRREAPGKHHLVERLMQEEPRIVGWVHRAHGRASTKMLGRRVGELIGRPLVEEVTPLSMGEDPTQRGDRKGGQTTGSPSSVRFEISPDSFFQTDPRWLPFMWKWIEEALQPFPGALIYDLYSGVGTFALPLAQHGCEVWGMEQSYEAVQDARRNAAALLRARIRLERGAVEQQLPVWLAQRVPDGVVLDPPRAGCDRRVLNALAAARVPRLAYLSCDSAILARDARILLEQGYRLEWAQPVNLFPRTYHVEVVAAFVYRLATSSTHTFPSLVA